MNTFEFTYLLNKPNAIKDKHTLGLEKIVNEFPFFQSARALQLKTLYNQESFQYNPALRKTAAYTTDRSVLFDFITSGNFAPVQKIFMEEKEAFIKEIIVNDIEIVTASPTEKTNIAEISTLEQSIANSIKEARIEETIAQKEPSLNKEETIAVVSEKLNIGKPLSFSKDEKHSFQEWLQLSNFNPIEREKSQKEENIANPEPIIDEIKQKKIAIIDRFIENNPKISPIKDTPKITPVPEQTQDQSYLMTETLAKVYLEQKKYQRAIQAYEILILKYPEKSSLFADRISDIRILQQNNN
ncbi:tetratricopeptide repeat protein [Flavobacterium sp.]|uniref:tetratricopeptide repeat protein n=1 Tax=Flavobacterium sp. TaxID=239 RepID=UPI00261A9301|nr:tetratricopeptide repeat protein [Flavobacterium sp.]MDD3004986.1 tetratricopeptide repeat protein [Flavobacterium sp.]